MCAVQRVERPGADAGSWRYTCTMESSAVSQGIAALLRSARESSGVTVEQLAEAAGLEAERLAEIEQGLEPRITEFVRLATALERAPSDLLPASCFGTGV